MDKSEVILTVPICKQCAEPFNPMFSDSGDTCLVCEDKKSYQNKQDMLLSTDNLCKIA